MSYEDNNLAAFDLTSKLSLLSFLPRQQTLDSLSRESEIITNLNSKIMGNKQNTVSKAATSLPAKYLCTEPKHVGIAIYSFMIMVVAITGEPYGNPIPLTPLVHICEHCYSKQISASDIPAHDKQSTALYLLQLGQKQLLLFLGFMTHLPTQGKAQIKPSTLFPGPELTNHSTDPMTETRHAIAIIHPKTSHTHPLPDLSNYLATTPPTQSFVPRQGSLPYQTPYHTPHSQYHIEDAKRTRFQEPPPGPPVVPPWKAGEGGPTNYRHAAKPFIEFLGNSKQTRDTMRVMNVAFRNNNCNSTPCIAYAHIEGRGCSKPGCSYRHFDLWSNIPAILQTAMAAWESDCTNVTIHKQSPGR